MSPTSRRRPRCRTGRIEQRAIWTSTELNGFLDFPGVGQVFMIERSRQDKKTGETGTETACGISSHTPGTANAQSLLALNRGPLVHREQLAPLPRLDLGRGPQPHTHRLRPREHDPACGASPSA